MTIYSRLGCVALLTAAPAWAAEPVPSVGPVPSWVVATDIPAPDPARAEAPTQILLTASQQRITDEGVESYVEVAAVAQTTAGLQALGNVTLPWNSERTEMTLHTVSIRRGDSTTDLLKPDEFLVLRRENNLERAVLDGVRTVVIPAKGLQTGDVLKVAFSYKQNYDEIASKPEDVHPLVTGFPIVRIERRFLIPDGQTVRWKLGLDAVKPQVTSRDGVTEHLFVQTQLEPPTVPEYTPARYSAPMLQLSGYASWSEVANPLQKVFAQARSLAPESSIAAEATQIAASTPDPGKRALSALRLAQERVRYVALLLGEGAYVPASADETWERKFGDCKGKTALLLALLDQLGIEAEPLLVSNSFDDRLAEQLPSLALFDHVIVRARIGGRALYLDATDYGQRTLEEMSGTQYLHGLPLRQNGTLEALDQLVLSAPSKQATLTWDTRNGTDGPVPYEATLTLRGSEAAYMRAKLSAATDVEKFDTGLKSIMPGIGNDDLEIVEKIPEAEDGSFVVRFEGDAEMDWSPFEGERNRRYAFSHSAFHWKADFDRDEGPGKDWPVFIGATPHWERLTETIILPDGGRKFSIEGEAVEKSFAGSTASRRFYQEGDRMMMMSEFRHLKREISAEEARDGKAVLEELNEDWAYVVGPPEKKQKSR